MIPSDLSPLANHLWQSTLFTVAAWMLTFAVRNNRAAVRYWIWFAASLKFLLPFSLLVSLGSRFHWSAASIAPPQFSQMVNQVGQPFLIPAGAPTLPSGATAGAGLTALLLGIWLTGVILGLVYWLRSLLRIRAILGTAEPLRLNLPVPVVSSARLLEPGVFGILRPVLVLPQGIAARLTPAQLEAVLAHELCHVRRRDNLTAAIHMAVETIFWFHPLVWWIRTQLVAERECACDEEVIRSAADPETYAEGILNVCKFYLDPHLACVSGVTGGNLKRRVERILAQARARNLTHAKKVMLAAVSAITVAGPLLVGLAGTSRSHAQSQSQKPPDVAFEVASIKVNPSISQDMSLNRTAGGGLTMVNGTLQTLIEFAYGLRSDQLSGRPAWLDTEHYDLVAKAPPGAKVPNPETPWMAPSDDPVRVRLQTLLAERSHLVVHRETKEMTIWALVQDKAGAKLKPWQEGDGPMPSMRLERRKLTCRKYTLSLLASNVLSRQMGRTVVDKTGIAGEFNFTMNFEIDPSAGPTFVEALREQLGLKLETQKGSVEILMIDHVAKPSPN